MRRLTHALPTFRTLPTLALILLLVVAGCSGSTELYPVTIAGEELLVEVADEPLTRRRGLMEREELPPRQGMLFVFERSEPRSFWMKNTVIPLSIAYLDDRLVIREIHDMEPLSLEPVRSSRPAKYALEVNQGAFEELGIQVGDRLVPSAALRGRLESRSAGYSSGSSSLSRATSSSSGKSSSTGFSSGDSGSFTSCCTLRSIRCRSFSSPRASFTPSSKSVAASSSGTSPSRIPELISSRRFSLSSKLFMIPSRVTRG